VGNPFMESSGSGALARVNRYNPLVFRGPSGAGLAMAYKFDDTFQLRGAYLADNASDPSQGQGLFNGSFSAAAQLVYNPTDALNLSFAYVHSYYSANEEQVTSNGGSFVDNTIRDQVSGSTRRALGRGVGRDPFLGSPATRDSYGLQANWRINETFNLSAYGGYALASAQGFDASGDQRQGLGADIWTWNAALSMVDLGKEGAVLTIAGGLAPTARRVEALTGDLAVPDRDSTYIIEGQYKYPLTKNILLTPGVYVIINPDGNSNNNSVWVGVLRTTFKF
jgi:carbohydrate-selective porin OprB